MKVMNPEGIQNSNSLKARKSGKSDSTASLGKTESKGGSSSKAVSKGDTVHISQAGTQLSEIRSKLNGVSDIRLDKVSELSHKIGNGEYKPSPEDVADAMIKTVLMFG